MNITLLIAQNEYRLHAVRRGFILALLSVPFFVGLLVVLIYVLVLLENDSRPLGYVDHAGVLAQAIPAPLDSKLVERVEMVSYPTEETARAALDSGEIQAYYLLPLDYLETNHAALVYIDDIGDDAEGQFWDFMRVNLMAGSSQGIVDFATKGADVIVRTPDGSREFSKSQILNILLPLFVAMGLMILILASSGYLIGIVADEKENQTMEVLITSVSPNQLIAGKLLGIMGLMLTQVTVWIGFGVGLFYIAGNVFGFEWAENIHVESSIILIMVAVMVPAYVMIAGLITAIGAMVSATQEGQQIAGFAGILLWLPFFFMQSVMESPHSPFVVGLSLFPLTAPMAITMRTVLSVVPSWQVTLSIGLLTASAFGSVWLAGRALRVGMLRYGQRLGLREIFNRP
jgi:ABC-2 type transport system permease protein